MKRIFDVTVAGLALVLLFPLLVLIAVAVWLGEPGPIIYRGERVGRGGHPFRILKFRSMTLRPTQLSQGGSDITARGDPRITRIGRILRLTKCDELPQLVNVLRGDMSLVGPRPEAPRYVVRYTEQQCRVLSVRPGITGPSQVYFRDEESLLAGPDPEGYYLRVVMPAKLAIDLQYVENHSFRSDLKIIFVTLCALVRPIAAPAGVLATLPPPTATSPISPLAAVTANDHVGKER